MEYKTIGTARLTLDVFSPPEHTAGDKRAAIVFFFGGGWTGGSQAQFHNQSKYLASRGMVSICADYRTEGSHGTSPKECVKDGKSAIRWIRQHAEELGVDPDRLAAGGGSAGGHVAAAAAIVEAFSEAGEDTSVSCQPNALVLFNPVFDNGPGGYGHDRVKGYWRKISPLHNIGKDAPPTVIFLGTKDVHVPVAVAEKFRSVMAGFGVRCDLHLYEDQGHGFFNIARYYETLCATDEFLVDLGYLSGSPALERK